MVPDMCQHGTVCMVSHADHHDSHLNRVHKTPGFVYGKIRLLENADGDGRLEVQVRPRAGNRPVCSVCGMPGPR